MSTKKKQQKISSRPKIEKPRVRNAQKSDDLDSPMDFEFGPPTGVDLPPEARDLLGKRCDSTDCSCRISPNVTCQVFSVTQGMVPAMIANASKGDLILCPGDGSGNIGALLGALQTPQVYSHMGIMIDNGMTIRHCTAVPSRMQAYPVGGTFDLPLPIDGFEPDKVTYGWPGTITQSVDEAYAATMPSSFLAVSEGQTAPYLYCDRDNGTKAFTGEDSHNFCFKMAELSFGPVFGLGGDRREPLVVKPCQAALSAHPEIRDILADVAEEAKGIAAHYRFYAYTNAAIAEDPAYQSEGPMPLYRWDPGEKMWKPVENLLFDPLNPCLTPAQQAPVKFTVPAVCSSLIWLAVRRYNSRNHKFQIVLDTYYPPTVSSPLEPDCIRTIPSPSMGATPDPAGMTPDGCYFFTEADRINVANSFHAGLKQDVQDTINDSVDKPWHSVATYIESHDAVSIPLLFSVGFVFGAAEAALWSVDGLSLLLGVSKASAKLIIDVFTSMPEHIANQLVNAFAVDNEGSADYTSDAWKSPGVGRAVGPDDTIWFWQPTISFEPTKDKTIVRGIYGANVPLIPQQPGPGSIPVCAWAYSPGPGQLSGMVRLRGQPTTGAGVGFANVIIACAEITTNHDGFYVLDYAAGNYWAVATWQDPKTGNFWKINEVVKVKFGGETVHDFILDPPTLDFRQVVLDVQGEAIDKTMAAGSPVWVFSSGFIPLGPRGDPSDPSDASGLTGPWKSGDMVFSEGRAVTVEVDANLSIKGFVTGLVTAHITHDGDSEHTETQSFAIAPDSSTPVIFNMSTAGWYPDVADITVTISNEQGYGPS